MAREVFIHNARLFKKSLSLAEIIGENKYEVSYLDENMRMTSQKSESGVTLLSDRSRLGRGVQVVESDKNAVHLAVNLPCTKEDIQMLYNVSRRIASLWKSDSIMVEDSKVSLTDIEKMEEHDIAMNKGLLSDAPSVFGDDYATLYCVTLPICIPVKQLQGYSEDYQGFSQYLDERQRLGAFYSCPIFYSLDGEIVSIYVGLTDGVFILPNKPLMSFMNDGEEVQCGRALVAIPEVFPDEKISKLDYQTFVDRIPKEKLSEFDCQHMLVSNLSIEELQSIFKGKSL